MHMSRIVTGMLATLLLVCVTACGEEETRTLEPETGDGNMQIRDGETTDTINLDPGPATEPDPE